MPHQCKQIDYCICEVTAVEPHDLCPKHGHPPKPRCRTCGRFLHVMTLVALADKAIKAQREKE